MLHMWSNKEGTWVWMPVLWRIYGFNVTKLVHFLQRHVNWCCTANHNRKHKHIKWSSIDISILWKIKSFSDDPAAYANLCILSSSFENLSRSHTVFLYIDIILIKVNQRTVFYIFALIKYGSIALTYCISLS